MPALIRFSTGTRRSRSSGSSAAATQSLTATVNSGLAKSSQIEVEQRPKARRPVVGETGALLLEAIEALRGELLEGAGDEIDAVGEVVGLRALRDPGQLGHTAGGRPA